MKVSPEQFAAYLDLEYGIVDGEGMPIYDLVFDFLKDAYPYHEIKIDEAYDDEVYRPLIKDLRYHALSLENEGQSLFVVGRHIWHKIYSKNFVEDKADKAVGSIAG